MNQFKCYFCTFCTDDHAEIIDHSVCVHPSERLKYRQLILDDTSGKFMYQTKSHVGIIPGELLKEGKTVVAVGNRGVSIQTLSKRKKLNTPAKTSYDTDRIDDTLVDDANDNNLTADEIDDDSQLNSFSDFDQLNFLLPAII